MATATLFQAFSALGLSMQQIHFYSYGTGNAHGDKGGGEWCLPAALLSMLTGKPVELSFSRRENFLLRTHQFQAKAQISIDTNKAGKLTAIDAKFWGSGGRNPLYEPFLEQDEAKKPNPQYKTKGIPLVWLGWPLQSTYKCSQASFEVNSVVTHRPRSGFWRCVADSPGTFLEDIAMEKKAYEIGKNPYEFKVNNLVAWNEPHQDSGVIPNLAGPLSSNGIKECYKVCAESIGFIKGAANYKWHDPKTKKVKNVYAGSTDERWHGIGIAGHVDRHGSLGLPNETLPTVTVVLSNDGKARLHVGISRAACGTNTAMSHIVADALGMSCQDVVVADWGNFGYTTPGGYQGGSTRTITLGAAYYQAAKDANLKLRQAAIAVKLFPTITDPNKLKVADSKIYCLGYSPTAVRDFMLKLNKPIIGKGTCWLSKLQRDHGPWKQGDDCEVFAACCSAVEVAVDAKTGEVEILNFVNAVDNGRAIFGYGSRKEIEGGIEIQIGQGLFYEQILDPKTGATLNADYIECKWPTSLDLDIVMKSDRYKPVIVETNDACGPFGCKGMGEPCVSNFVCIANAIYNAIGKWITEPPFYPQKILAVL